MLPPILTPPGGPATALPDVFNHGPPTLAILAVLILAGPYRRDVARLLRASADVLDSPARP